MKPIYFWYYTCDVFHLKVQLIFSLQLKMFYPRLNLQYCYWTYCKRQSVLTECLELGNLLSNERRRVLILHLWHFSLRRGEQGENILTQLKYSLRYSVFNIRSETDVSNLKTQIAFTVLNQKNLRQMKHTHGTAYLTLFDLEEREVTIS